MEILWCTKASRADIYSQFVSALRTTAGCVKRRSRRAGPVCPAAKYALLPAGHVSPALQGAAVAWGGQGRPPLHVLRGTSRTPSRQRGSPRCKAPSVRGLSAQPTGGEKKPRDVSPSASASRCHLPRRGRLWSSAPLTNRLGWV